MQIFWNFCFLSPLKRESDRFYDFIRTSCGCCTLKPHKTPFLAIWGLDEYLCLTLIATAKLWTSVVTSNEKTGKLHFHNIMAVDKLPVLFTWKTRLATTFHNIYKLQYLQPRKSMYQSAGRHFTEGLNFHQHRMLQPQMSQGRGIFRFPAS
jgi:hypothetical protein